MESRALGRTDMRVGAVALGCWAIGGPFWDQGGWMGYGPVDDAQSERALARGLDLGATLLDVADVYGCGHAERIVGRVVASRRDRVVLAVKFGWTFDEATRTVTGRDVSATAVRAACEASLRRLGTTWIDLYQLHPFDLEIERALEVRDVLDDLAREGKIRAYAWCTEDPARIRAFAEGSTHVAALPQLLNVLEHQPALLELCEELDLCALARRPLGMGLFTGKYDRASAFPENDMRRRFKWDLRAGKQAAQLSRVMALRELLQHGGRTLAQGAIGWILAKSLRAIPMPGFKTVAQVEENLGAVRFGPLPDDVMAAIASIG